ncbi:hypothetical protein [Comamonas sp. 4034]|uniref:hypothetical protein n=1 Tax=Comamonas sp. 4034 TaxID=3156455 RepID=UPI003D1D7D0C
MPNDSHFLGSGGVWAAGSNQTAKLFNTKLSTTVAVVVGSATSFASVDHALADAVDTDNGTPQVNVAACTLLEATSATIEPAKNAAFLLINLMYKTPSP